MKTLIQYLPSILLIIFLLTFFWVVGFFLGFRVIPNIVVYYDVISANNNYHLNVDESLPLYTGIVLRQTEDEKVRLSFLNNDSDSKCFTLKVSSVKGNHLFKLDSLSFSLFDPENAEIPKMRSDTLFCEGTYPSSCAYEIGNNYEIAVGKEIVIEQSESGKIVHFENPNEISFEAFYDPDLINEFSILINLNYSIDNKRKSIKQKIVVKKKHGLTWTQYRNGYFVGWI